MPLIKRCRKWPQCKKPHYWPPLVFKFFCPGPQGGTQ